MLLYSPYHLSPYIVCILSLVIHLFSFMPFHLEPLHLLLLFIHAFHLSSTSLISCSPSPAPTAPLPPPRCTLYPSGFLYKDNNGRVGGVEVSPDNIFIRGLGGQLVLRLMLCQDRQPRRSASLPPSHVLAAIMTASGCVAVPRFAALLARSLDCTPHFSPK